MAREAARSSAVPATMFRAVSTRRTFEEAVEQIAEAIKAGDVHVGARLPSERDLARDMAIREPYEPEHAIGIHERTLAAVKSGDPDEIDRAMDEHLAFLEQIWE